jgi:hypothetical protein
LLVTRTSCTGTGVSSIAKEVMPSPQQLFVVFPHNRRDTREFSRAEAIVARNLDRLQPEFARIASRSTWT